MAPATAPAPLTRGNSRRSGNVPIVVFTLLRDGVLDNAIRSGFIFKRPVGFSLTRSWRKRFFVLRPNTIDYYDPGQQQQQQASATTSAASSIEASPTHTPPDSRASPLQSTIDGKSDESGSGSVILPSSASSSSLVPPPPNLTAHHRGSVTLDALTTVVCVAYSDAFGFEVTTRDKLSKLYASSDAERQSWVRDILAVVSCIERGVDPAIFDTWSYTPIIKSRGSSRTWS